MYKLSENSKKNRDGVDQRLIEISDLAIKITAVDFGHPADGGLRTAERQYELYADGKSECDGVKNKSRHQSGLALDFYAFVNGKASWEPLHLAMVASAFLQAASILGYKLSWGGLFEPYKTTDGMKHGWDMPHVELVE